MSFNQETFDLMLKLAFGMIGILLLIWLIAVFTPKLAKFVDKTFGKTKIDPGPSSITLENGEKYTVKSIFEGEKPAETAEEAPKAEERAEEAPKAAENGESTENKEATENKNNEKE